MSLKTLSRSPFHLLLMLSLVLFSFNFSSCGLLSKKKPNMFILYESLGNDQADIKLALFENNQFKLTMRFLDENETFVFGGRWETVFNYYQLEFGEEAPDLEDINETEQDGLKILGSRRMRIYKNVESIELWGIHCEKKVKI